MYRHYDNDGSRLAVTLSPSLKRLAAIAAMIALTTGGVAAAGQSWAPGGARTTTVTPAPGFTGR